MRMRTISTWRWVGSVCLILVTGATLMGQQSLSRTLRREVAEPDSPAATQPQLADSAQTSPDSQTVVPRLIKFSGNLNDLSGKPISGPVDVTFSLYTDEAGGSPLWFETQTVQASSLGHYTVLLGAMTPAGVPMELFTDGEAKWLGVQVSNLPEQPRVLLVSVPYAMKAGDAETLGGKPASAFMPATSGSGADTSATTAATLSGLVQANALTSNRASTAPLALTATQSYIPVMTDNAGSLGNSLMYQLGSRIGVGTTAPAFGFDLNSNVFAIGPKQALLGAGGTMRFRDDSGTVRWSFGIPGTGGATDFFLYNNVNGHGPLYIQAGAASYSLYLNANGNVGVGTTSPAHKLDVAGDINASGTISGNGSGLTNVGSSSTVILGSTASFTGDVSTSSNLDLPATSSASAGVISLNGSPFIHACCLNSAENTFVGPGAGNFTADATTSTGGTGINTGVGYLALASLTTGFDNTAIGAAALHSNTAGVLNTASGFDALYSNTLGVQNTASGFNALYSNTTGNYNTALGLRADVTAGNLTYATAIGACSKVSAGNALVLGALKDGCQSGSPSANTKVGIGTTSPAAPLEVKAPGYLVARFTNDGTASDHSVLVDTLNGDGVLWRHGVGGTGNGLGLTSGQFYIEQSGHGARLLIDTSGNVGIGTTLPSYPLQVESTAAAAIFATTSAALANTIEGDAYGEGGKGVLGISTSGTGSGVYGDNTGGGYGVYSSGNAHVQGDLSVSGDVTYSGGGCLGSGCSSDERLKTKIRLFSPSLDQLAELQPVRFNWRASNTAGYPVGSERAIGLIAQQVKRVFPQMVGKDKNGYYTVNYTMLPFMLLAGVRQLKTRNDSLRAEVEESHSEIAKLAAQNRKLTSQLEHVRKAQEHMAQVVERLARAQGQTQIAEAVAP
jgi:Chaperone of endosialidase